ncbi:MAG: hypothetical protein AABZ55_05575 [Bdellovibrionota bacterium]
MKKWFSYKNFLAGFLGFGMSLGAAVIGCAPNSSNGYYTQGLWNTNQTVNIPPNACAGMSTMDYLSPYIQTAIIGTYDGTMWKEDANFNLVSVPFTIQLSRAQTQGTTAVPGAPVGTSYGSYAYLNFQSQGVDGVPISFQSCLNLDWGVGMGTSYSFTTSTLSNPAMSSTYFQLAITLGINGSQFDPAQSLIRILDCGFSQSGYCGSMSYDVNFNSTVLVKRK